MIGRTFPVAAFIAASASVAAAQPVSIDQITSTNRHVADVEQVPASRGERVGAAAPAPSLIGAPSGAMAAPGALRRGAAQRSTVDAEEIARLLGEGQVGSIDAAAAVAAGAVDVRAASAVTPAASAEHDDSDTVGAEPIAPRE